MRAHVLHELCGQILKGTAVDEHRAGSWEIECFEKCYMWNQHLSLVAWGKSTAGVVVVVPRLLAGSASLLSLTFADFSPIHLTSEDKKKSVWYTILGGLPTLAPEIPPLQRTAHFPSTISTSFKRHLNIGDIWRYCQNKRILNCNSPGSDSWATFPTLWFNREKTKQLVRSMESLNFTTDHPRLGVRGIGKKGASNERTFPVDPDPTGEIGTRP